MATVRIHVPDYVAQIEAMIIWMYCGSQSVMMKIELVRHQAITNQSRLEMVHGEGRTADIRRRNPTVKMIKTISRSTLLKN